MRAIMSSALFGVEHGTRSITAVSGSNAADTAIASSAPPRSPEGEEIATSASSSRSARTAIAAASSEITLIVGRRLVGRGGRGGSGGGLERDLGADQVARGVELDERLDGG